MKAIILCAGVSSRLRPITDTMHKCLIQLGSKALIEHQLDAIAASPPVERIVLVIGHKGDLIRARIGDTYKGIPVKYIYNEYYREKSINHSLYLTAEEIIDDQFIYIEGDVLFDRTILFDLINSTYEDSLVADGDLKSKKVDTIATGRNGIVESLQFKEHGDFRGRLGDIKDVIGEVVLLIKFGRRYGRLIVDELERQSRSSRETHLYGVFDELFRKQGMNYIQIHGRPWIEIDNFDDLRQAQQVFPKLTK